MPSMLSHSKPREFLAPVRNDRGAALILVLIMIVLLSILGVTVLTSTTSDLHITANNRNLDDAFYTAEAGLDFSEANGVIYSSLLPATATVWPAPGLGVKVNADGTVPAYSPSTANDDYPNYNRVTVYKDAARTVRNYAHVKVDYISTGAVPSGLGTEVDAGLGSGTGFKANFYVVDVIGENPASHSHVELESHIVRVVPK